MRRFTRAIVAAALFAALAAPAPPAVAHEKCPWQVTTLTSEHVRANITWRPTRDGAVLLTAVRIRITDTTPGVRNRVTLTVLDQGGAVLAHETQTALDRHRFTRWDGLPVRSLGLAVMIAHGERPGPIETLYLELGATRNA